MKKSVFTLLAVLILVGITTSGPATYAAVDDGCPCDITPVDDPWTSGAGGCSASLCSIPHCGCPATMQDMPNYHLSSWDCACGTTCTRTCTYSPS